MKKIRYALLLTCIFMMAVAPVLAAQPEANPAPEVVKKSPVLELGGYLVLVNRDHRIRKTSESEDLL